MEAHEGVVVGVAELTVNGILVHVVGHGIVDIQQRDRVLADAGADELAQTPVDIHFTGYRNTHAGETAVDIAGHETELGLESGPAFSGDGHILAIALVGLDPVKQRQLVLGQLGQDFGLLVARAQLLLHLLHLGGNPLVSLMLLEGLEEIQLGILLDFHAQVVELLDGRVAGQEVQGPGAEGDDLQAAQSHDGPCDGDELVNPVGALRRGAHGILGYVCLHVAQLQVIAGVEHAAVGIAPAAHQVVLALLGSRDVHGGAVEMLGQKGLGDFRAEVAQVHAQGVAAVLLDVLQGLHHVNLALHDAHGALVDGVCAVLGGVGLYQGFPPVHGQALGEAVAAHGHDADFYFRQIVHVRILLWKFNICFCYIL